MGKNRGVCVNEGSGYQAPRTSHEPKTELLTSHEDGMRVRGDGEPDHQFYTASTQVLAVFYFVGAASHMPNLSFRHRAQSLANGFLIRCKKRFGSWMQCAGAKEKAARKRLCRCS